MQKIYKRSVVWSERLENMTRKHTRFEKARIVGARALQISMGAPPLIQLPKGLLDPVDIALEEYEKSVIPISVIREE